MLSHISKGIDGEFFWREIGRIMVKSGDILHNPLSGETFTILKTSTETNGKLLQMETSVPAKQGTHVPPHLHPAHAMRLTILQGGMKLWVGKPQNRTTV